jgi:bifunctional ADP-heptose synthase (sugar kinase/adenylyltransferase)
MPERSLVESYGGRVVLLPFVDGVSTTSIVSRLGG